MFSPEESDLLSGYCANNEDGSAPGIARDIPHPDLDDSSPRQELVQQRHGAKPDDHVAKNDEPTQTATDNVSTARSQGDDRQTENGWPPKLTQISTTRANRDIMHDDWLPSMTNLYFVRPRNGGMNEQDNRRIDDQLKTLVGEEQMYISDTKYAGVDFWRTFLTFPQAELIRGMPEVNECPDQATCCNVTTFADTTKVASIHSRKMPGPLRDPTDC
ncbi:hypothetical protein PG997_008961 [Apiospora hydei]|uniref:Transposase n=1 Tax=Apiospora hydei TaxID=1337664 RepID=A0ABR1WCJ2_9PEZI